MASSFNQVTLLGNITRDIEVRFLGSGTAVCDLGLAVNDKKKQSDGSYVDETSFIDCTCFGRTAEIAGEYLAKGRPVLIAGRLKQERWQDKNNGQNRTKVKVIVDKLTLLGGGQNQNGQQQGGNQHSQGSADGYYDDPQANNSGEFNEDNVPF